MRKLVAVLGLGVMLSGCSWQSTAVQDSSPAPRFVWRTDHQDSTPQVLATTSAEGAQLVPVTDLYQTISSSPQHTQLKRAVEAAGLIDLWQGPGPYTVLAPIDEAYADFHVGTFAELFSPNRQKDLIKVVQYQMIPGRYTTRDLVEGLILKTVQGQPVTVRFNEGSWYIQDAVGNYSRVLETNIVADNGIILVLDRPIVPWF